MLNESRIKLMTKMAVYEEHEGKKSMSIGTYFRGDYIGKEVIKSIIYATIAYVIVIAVYVCYDFEILAQEIYNMDLIQFGTKMLKDYLKLVVGYAIITYVFYAMRYQKARRSLRSYYNNLRRLNSMYRKEEAKNK
ncbi:MAG: hypothetical protein J6K26_09165 [Lachnospiraceae bacterium]|nr:hypothetical protein [Lachnospiraceae bacterium]